MKLLTMLAISCWLLPVAGADEYVPCKRGQFVTDNYGCEDLKVEPKDQPAEEAKDCVSIPDGLCDKQSDAEKWREKCDFWLNLADTKKTTPNNYAWFADRSIPYCTRYNAALLNEIRENQK